MDAMTATIDRWLGWEETHRERLNAYIQRQPEFLFERDGGPLTLKADLYWARLIGFEDEVVDDVTLTRPEFEIHLPLPIRPTAQIAADPHASLLHRTARYVLQSNWATFAVSAICGPPGLPYSADTFLCQIAFLRYRRRS